MLITSTKNTSWHDSHVKKLNWREHLCW